MARWKRGVSSQGIKQALDYALAGSCDASTAGAEAATGYADERVSRFIVEDGQIRSDQLSRSGLQTWISGYDPKTGDPRGREIPRPEADLLLDATVNSSKSFSIAAMLDPDIEHAYGQLMDRLRDRTILSWQRELNARRGHAGAIREELSRIEVVELKHERSRALDPHKHRHLWLNIKVRGQDGRWSNVDSRVAMRFQTVVNAEGDLAARTDPEWLSALAAKGFTIDPDGEVEQLAHLVRPLSRRSNQIEANRAVRLAKWYADHDGQEPSAKDLMAIDQWAYALNRPNKPEMIDENDWAQVVVSELTAIDPAVTTDRGHVRVARVAVADVDRDLLAATGVANADVRATGTGGRFSMFDVRAGVVRAVAASGVVADRVVLDELIEDAVGRAVRDGATNLLDRERAIPGHVKNLMSNQTMWLKADVARQYAGISEAGIAVGSETVQSVASEVMDNGHTLDPGQANAAGIIAGTDRVVAVTGPAGTGKTTMLKVAKRLLANQGRGCIIVATTKKAAQVAGRETGTQSSSVHALLRDHGWYWGKDQAGQHVWQQVSAGAASSFSARPYRGVTSYPLKRGDRIVVDEAGMLGLNEARALAIVAQQTGASVALLGDHLQVRPVGHSGAMAIAKMHATASEELATVQRFRCLDENGRDAGRDEAYADLTLRLRDPGSEQEALQVARELIDGGHTVTVPDERAVLDFMAGEYLAQTAAGKSVAMVTSTNAEAQAINEVVQSGRISRGEVDQKQAAVGRDDQVVYVGDVVQTRSNNAEHDVSNRDVWIVSKVASNGSVQLESVDHAGARRSVPAEYFAEHAHLAYASTVHGIQGETSDVSITGPGVDASGLYVGMTRGKHQDLYVSTAKSSAALADELAESMRRGRPELSAGESVSAAQIELDRAARDTSGPYIEISAAISSTAARAMHGIDQTSSRDRSKATGPVVQQRSPGSGASRR